MWGYSVESWHQWCLDNNLDPNDIAATMQKIQEGPKLVCIKCDQPLNIDEVHIYIDPTAPIIFGKYFHGPCFIQHVEENVDNPNDLIMIYILRKRA